MFNFFSVEGANNDFNYDGDDNDEDADFDQNDVDDIAQFDKVQPMGIYNKHYMIVDLLWLNNLKRVSTLHFDIFHCTFR